MDERDVKKEAIAAAAKDLFGSYGYKTVSMERIAAKAGVAKGTVYLYFRDKAELFQYLLEQFLTAIRRWVEEIKSRRLPVSEEIAEVVYELLCYRKDQKFLFRIFNEAHELRTPIARDGVRQIDGLLEEYLNDRLAPLSGLSSQRINVAVLSFVILKAYSALAFEWEEAHAPLNERQIAQTIGILLQGVFDRAAANGPLNER